MFPAVKIEICFKCRNTYSIPTTTRELLSRVHTVKHSLRISTYNDERPHMSIGNQTPSVAHTQVGPQQKMWKNPWENSSN